MTASETFLAAHNYIGSFLKMHYCSKASKSVQYFWAITYSSCCHKRSEMNNWLTYNYFFLGEPNLGSYRGSMNGLRGGLRSWKVLQLYKNFFFQVYLLQVSVNCVHLLQIYILCCRFLQIWAVNFVWNLKNHVIFVLF